MARMSHKFLSKMARFQPPYEQPEAHGGKMVVKDDDVKSLEPLSPLTSIADSDEDEERMVMVSIDPALQDNDSDITPMEEDSGAEAGTADDDEISASKTTSTRSRPRMKGRSGPRRSTFHYNGKAQASLSESETRSRRQNQIRSHSSASAGGNHPRSLKPGDSKMSLTSRPGTNTLMCHQCRSTNKWAKMACTNMPESGARCKRRYCANCVLKRYPEITFDALSKTFVCPSCEGICNCTVCCKKRGEDYVSTRFAKVDEEALRAICDGEVPGKRASASAGDVRPSKRAKKSNPKASSKKTSTDPLTKTTAIIEKHGGVSGEYWGAVFSVRGERIGRGFIGESLSDIIVKEEDEIPYSKKRRVYVGRWQESWGSPDEDTDNKDRLVSTKEESSAAEKRSRRLYAGDTPVLRAI